MTRPTLFRTEANAARQVNWLGEVVLIRPVSFTVLTSAAAGCAACLLAFLLCGTYTKRTTVSGQLVPDGGLVKVFSAQKGIILKKLVFEGKSVNKGDVLYILSSERYDRDNGSVEGSISDQVKSRRGSLIAQRDKTVVLQKEEHIAFTRKFDAIQSEMAKLDSLIEGQRRRLTLSENTVSRYEGLLLQNYISKETAQQKQEDLLDQSNRLRTLERDRISLGREYIAVNSELNTLSIRQQNQLAVIERDIAGLSQEVTESDARRGQVITAPESGIATAVVAEVGQAVDSARPLVSLVPAGALLQADLYVSSRNIGFIRSGDKVLLRYQAFPFQKFGHARAMVMSVSRTTLPVSELDALGYSRPNDSSNEPLYRVTVQLTAQTITAYGKQHSLQAGMLLDADVLQDTRKIFEWVLEPLFTLSGKL